MKMGKGRKNFFGGDVDGRDLDNSRAVRRRHACALVRRVGEDTWPMLAGDWADADFFLRRRGGGGGGPPTPAFIGKRPVITHLSTEQNSKNGVVKLMNQTGRCAVRGKQSGVAVTETIRITPQVEMLFAQFPLKK
ncbi:hypothetical protein NL676_022621 [Syzygium grande]|nr:hypothetical protein NL676_022621 [Syzygium grande]